MKNFSSLGFLIFLLAVSAFFGYYAREIVGPRYQIAASQDRVYLLNIFDGNIWLMQSRIEAEIVAQQGQAFSPVWTQLPSPHGD